MEKLKIIAIVGPTSSGKSALAVKLAKKFRGEIVSADSRQIYKGMDVGTAKPTKKELKIVPHYLIDIKNPNQNYTLSQYKNDAIKAINKIIKRGKIPFLAGGTGLYIDAVIDNLEIPQVKPNQKLRKKLEKEIETKGLKYVFDKLVSLDPESAYIIDPNNPRRVIRALEITLLTNKPFSQQRKKGEPLFHTLKIGLALPPEKLQERINKRVDLMLKNGLLKEVKNLLIKYGSKPIAFDAIGYREIIDYFRGKIPREEVINLIKKNTWRFAKRQMTWFKRDKNICWIDSEKQAEKLARRFID
ncbi:MAG: tRNA (adenosine(37)-N6)-dimethylallyltransferase MiaA [Candidatus Niyogibacteria bacterium RIFCSPLOWO2_12_FULL_41_13]|uniref:tRNA dimethylallyltransferase n=1 Tax=Candidatus Niyogibacteria bacterium RIFCSPLOWO2_12_FULL_41_13 TaxID=1801726 RepID=A0A1G2F2D0_9BACT|nr:MAG: tRNA (adenosine(37)-N6)-dimethylallyltransferase MiaA [Candidatus Niyogibacteria bacterium RIFCSPLOWO2_12_FULL_41_13]